MNGSKSWYTSTGVWGSVATILITIAGLFHIAVDAQTAADLVHVLVLLGGFIGGCVSLYGRIRATKQLTAGSTPAATPKLVLALLLCGAAVFLTGCPSQTSQPGAATRPSGPDNTAKLTLVNNGATFVLNSLANARDNGLLTQATLNQYKPAIDAFAAAKARAEQELKSGDTNAYADAISQLSAAYARLVPLLSKISVPTAPPLSPAATTQPAAASH
jgi:hypothetical protein